MSLESTIVLASLLALSMALGIPIGAIMDKVGHKKEFMYFFGVLQGIFAMAVYVLQPGNMIAVILVAGLTQTFYNATFIRQQSIYQDLVPEKQRGSLLIYQVVGFVIPSFPAALVGGWIADMTPIPGQYNPLIFIIGGFFIIISVLFIIPVKEVKKQTIEVIT